MEHFSLFSTPLWCQGNDLQHHVESSVTLTSSAAGPPPSTGSIIVMGCGLAVSRAPVVRLNPLLITRVLIHLPAFSKSRSGPESMPRVPADVAKLSISPALLTDVRHALVF